VREEIGLHSRNIPAPVPGYEAQKQRPSGPYATYQHFGVGVTQRTGLALPPPPVGAVSSADLDLDLDLSTQHTIKFTLHVRIVSAIGAAGLGLNFAI
jgi:hypothetical protein